MGNSAYRACLYAASLFIIYVVYSHQYSSGPQHEQRVYGGPINGNHSQIGLPVEIDPWGDLPVTLFELALVSLC